MDVIRTRQEVRHRLISEIMESIKKGLEKDQELTKKDVRMAVMANLGLASRTAKEYVDVAVYKLGIDMK